MRPWKIPPERRFTHRIDADAAERLVSGAPAGGPHAELRRVLDAAAGPPTPDELRGERDVLAAFRAARQATAIPTPEPRRRPTRPRRLLVGGLAGLTAAALGGTAVAATQGALPDPIQRTAHELFAGLGVPAPTKEPSAQPDSSTGPSGAASGIAVPGAPTPDELKQASLVRLCRSWQATRDNPNAKALTAEELRTLLNAAGGDAALPGYCERLLASAVAPDPSGGPDPAKTANKGGHGPPERTPDPDRTKSTGKPSMPADPNRRPSDHG